MGSEDSISLHYWPTTPDGYHMDVVKGIALIERTSPKMVVLGKSLFLFPEPVKEIAEVCRAKNIPVLYDAAHVLGLILGGQFQDPFREGVHFIAASVHKTFPGPQRGVILGNCQSEIELNWWSSIDRGIMPGSSSNHHLHTIPGLLVAIREMKAFGQAYARQIVSNAKALGRAFSENHIQVEAEEFGFTESHQIALKVSKNGSAKEIARQLSENNIIVNYNLLPGDQDPKNPTGLRIGVQELTRFGMKEKEMGEVAALISAVLEGKKVKEEVIQLRSRFQEIHYCLTGSGSNVFDIKRTSNGRWGKRAFLCSIKPIFLYHSFSSAWAAMMPISTWCSILIPWPSSRT